MRYNLCVVYGVKVNFWGAGARKRKREWGDINQIFEFEVLNRVDLTPPVHSSLNLV